MLFDHSCSELRILDGHRSDDHAESSDLCVIDDDIFVSDTAAYFHFKACSLDDVAYCSKVRLRSVDRSVKVHHVKILCAGVLELLRNFQRILPVHSHLVIITLKKTNYITFSEIDSRKNFHMDLLITIKTRKIYAVNFIL